MTRIDKRQIRSVNATDIVGNVSGSLPAGVVSGSSQLDGTTIDNLTVTNGELSGSFSGSYVGDGSGLSGVTSYTDTDTRRVIDEEGTVSGSSQIDVTQTTNYGSINQYTDADNLSYMNSIQVLSGSISFDGLVSSSAQIDHDQTTNYVAGEHFLQSAISITESQISDLTHFTIGDLPSGTVSGSSQIVLTSGQVTDALTFTPYNATNPSGYTTNTGTVTNVATGTGLSGTITTTGTITLSLNSLAEKTGNLVGTDRLVGLTSTTHWAETISAIPLSIFSNDSGWTSNAGTVTSVGTSGTVNGITLTGTVTTTGTLTLGGSLSGITVSQLDPSAVQTSGEGFTDVDTTLMTSAAIQDKILSYGYTTNTGTVTSVSGGTGLSSTGGTTPSISLDNTAVAAGSYTLTNLTVDAQGRITAASNGSASVVNNATITLSAGVGLITGGAFTTNQSGNETITFTLAVDELAEKTGAVVGTDRITGTSGTTNFSETISNIPLSIFSNDNGWTSNTGDITGVTAGNGITGGATSGTATVTLGTPSTISGATTNSVTATSHTHEWSNTPGYTTNIGTITSIATGTGLDGGTVTSGGITISCDFSEFTAVDGSLLVNSTDYMLVLDGTVEQKILLQNVKNSWFNNDAGYTTNTGTMSSWTIMEGNGTETTTVTNGETFQIEQGTGIQSELTSTAGGGVITITNTAPNVVQTITLTGDVTGTGTGTFATTIATDAVDIAMLSATGTPGTTTYLRGDNTWTVPPNTNTTNFNIQANGGTQTNISAGEEINFINGTNTTAVVVNQANPTVTFNMNTGGAGAATYGSTSNATKIDTITLDAYGRVTAVATGAVGDIQGVTAGTGMTGGGTSGTVTLNVIGGTGITANADDIALSTDRRHSANADVYDGNTSDYLFYDASVGMRFYTAGAEDMRLTDAGTLHVDGDVIAYSTTISDERLKDDILPITNPLQKIKDLNGVSYTWNAGSKKGQKDLGVIAQDVEKVLPEIVTEHEMPFIDEKLYKTVDYEKLSAVLIEGMKEQQKIIESLTERITKLENK